MTGLAVWATRTRQNKISIKKCGLVLAAICGIIVAPLRSIRTAFNILSTEEFSPDHLIPDQEDTTSIITGVNERAPLFVLSLPNSGSNALQRYFQCAGLKQSTDLGKYFINQRENTPKKELQEIGRCLHNNLKTNRSILEGCGNFQVWLDMDIARFSLCYYPSINGLEALTKEYPNASILQVVRDPIEWKAFQQDEWIQFYDWHVHHVRSFAQRNPSLRYIEINLDVPSANSTATTLQQHLGVDPQCWTDSIDPPGVLVQPPRPNDITYPLLVAALSKSGTTTVHDYFTCGLGGGTSIHTWTKNQTTKQQLYLGQCLEYNIQHDRPLFQECSYYKVWTDIQYLTKPKGAPGVMGAAFSNPAAKWRFAGISQAVSTGYFASCIPQCVQLVSIRKPLDGVVGTVGGCQGLSWVSTSQFYNRGLD